MVSLETLHISSPARISFSADLLQDDPELGDLISSSNTNNVVEDHHHHQLSMKTMLSIIKTKKKKEAATAGCEERPATTCRRNVGDFEFLCSAAAAQKMVSADELFSDGKLLPYWQMDRLTSIQTKPAPQQNSIRMSSSSSEQGGPHGGGRVTWGFMDDDPSPRPPKCTVLWKELLRIKKNKPHSSLSPSSSSGSSSSSSSSMAADSAATAGNNEIKKKTESSSNNLKKRIQRGLERTSSATIRIRPMVNVPIVKTGSSLPPLFPIKKASRSVVSL